MLIELVLLLVLLAAQVGPAVEKKNSKGELELKALLSGLSLLRLRSFSALVPQQLMENLLQMSIALTANPATPLRCSVH